MKLASLILRIVASVLLVAAFSCLFIPSTIAYKNETVEVTTETGESKVLTSVVTTRMADEDNKNNFFGRWKVIGEAGCPDPVEGLILIFLVAAFVVVLTSCFIDHTNKIYFAAISLVFVVLCIVFASRSDAWILLHSRVMQTTPEYEVYKQNSVMFGFSIVPTLICAIAAFLSQLTSGVFELLMNRKEKIELED